MSDPSPIHVAAGLGWTATGACATALRILTLIIRQVGQWKKQATEEDENLRVLLMARSTAEVQGEALTWKLGPT
jgi:hypothetical protein